MNAAQANVSCNANLLHLGLLCTARVLDLTSDFFTGPQYQRYDYQEPADDHELHSSHVQCHGECQEKGWD